ncbi:MAG: OST-HTH/LOTUS domain-containing protein, partial [Syntrophomonadaceae bacterium]|nr:OST-HTH/LOTUS domain-containing protein [Syntrophomonadaceae bacterium]
VIGIGEKKTPKPFIAACEKFKYLEILATVPSNQYETNVNGKKEKQEVPKEGMASKDQLIESIKIIITETSDEDGWAFLGEVGNRLNRRYPDFDTRNYGYSKLTPLISSLEQFQIQSRKTRNSNITLKYIKNINQ